MTQNREGSISGDLAKNLTSAAKPNLSQPERWVEEYGDSLYAFALMRVRDPVKAEDFVQETFLAALKSNFAGKSSEKSWLIGILKNKIFDYYRKLGRETTFTDLEFFAKGEAGSFESEGPKRGHWLPSEHPEEWENVGSTLDREEFWKAFHACTGKLPKNIAQVFILREVDDLDSRAICDLVNISPSNLWVMLHRARMALRRCLETNWFAPDARKKS